MTEFCAWFLYSFTHLCILHLYFIIISRDTITPKNYIDNKKLVDIVIEIIY